VTHGREQRGSREEEGIPAEARATGTAPARPPVELRRKAVQLCVEEGFPVEQVARDLRVGLSTLGSGFEVSHAGRGGPGGDGAPPRNRKPQVAPAVKRQAVALKRRHPDLGIQKISQFLRRVLFLP